MYISKKIIFVVAMIAILIFGATWVFAQGDGSSTTQPAGKTTRSIRGEEIGWRSMTG